MAEMIRKKRLRNLEKHRIVHVIRASLFHYKRFLLYFFILLLNTKTKKKKRIHEKSDKE
jgi:hypothetical protein